MSRQLGRRIRTSPPQSRAHQDGSPNYAFVEFAPRGRELAFRSGRRSRAVEDEGRKRLRRPTVRSEMSWGAWRDHRRHSRRHRILIIVENCSVPRDRRVWKECLTLVEAGFEVSVIAPRETG